MLFAADVGDAAGAPDAAATVFGEPENNDVNRLVSELSDEAGAAGGAAEDVSELPVSDAQPASASPATGAIMAAALRHLPCVDLRPFVASVMRIPRPLNKP
jgi:hypothetical protein